VQVNNPVVLVADDDPAMRQVVCDALGGLAGRFIEAHSGDEALRRVQESPPTLIITDLKMPGGGLTYLEGLRSLVPDRPILLVTACGDWTTRTGAARHGVTAWLVKPVGLATLRDAASRLLHHHPLLRSHLPWP
jgi:CheY-like chemotaxis protein